MTLTIEMDVRLKRDRGERREPMELCEPVQPSGALF